MELILKANLPNNTTLDSEPIKLDSPKFAIGDKVYWKQELEHPENWREYYVNGIQLKWHVWKHDPTSHVCDPGWIYQVNDRLGGGWGCTADAEELVSQTELDKAIADYGSDSNTCDLNIDLTASMPSGEKK